MLAVKLQLGGIDVEMPPSLSVSKQFSSRSKFRRFKGGLETFVATSEGMGKMGLFAVQKLAIMSVDYDAVAIFRTGRNTVHFS
uniref:Acyl-CoA_dh_1 domain-containing protein n=1 Tax=Ascaris lumbricoides TaxID=6252 RepID=A0A0M3HZA4_ASCLU